MELKKRNSLLGGFNKEMSDGRPKSQAQQHESFKKDPPDETKGRVFLHTFCEVFESSTMHALPNAIRNQFIFMKIFWTILFLAGTGACIYYLYATIAAYLEFNTVTTVTKYLQTVQTFPSVTICNINPLDLSNPNTSLYVQQILIKNGLSSNITLKSDEYSIYIVRKYMDVIKSSALSDLNGASSYVRSLGFDISYLLISCYFNGYACNASDFHWFYTYEYGNCYIFNYNSGNNSAVKSVSQSGPRSGLQLELFAGNPGLGDRYMEQSGFYVSVSNNSQLSLTKYEGVFVPTGFASKIAVEKTYYYKMESPYSDCRKNTNSYSDSDSEYYKTTVKTTKYTQKLCFEICLQYEYIIPTCGCSDASILATNSSQTVCHLWNDIRCASNVTQQFNSKDLSETCGQYCPLECDSQEFDYLISTANYPTTSYYSIVSKQSNIAGKFLGGGGVSQTSFAQACALVNVYLDELYYTEIVESPAITIEEVFGTIGGQMGLYIGASFLTFFEIFEFLVLLCWKTNRYRKEKRVIRDLNRNI